MQDEILPNQPIALLVKIIYRRNFMEKEDLYDFQIVKKILVSPANASTYTFI